MNNENSALMRQETTVPPRYAWYLVFVLTATSTLSFIDRQIPAIMTEHLFAEFQISGKQMGLLLGAAFVWPYTLFTAPSAYLADRVNRRRLIACGIVIWSLMTCLSAFATSYEMLFATRAGVGIGEAILAPAAYSMIAQSLPYARVPLGLAVFSAAPFLGVGLSFITGGAIDGMMAENPSVAIPLLGTFSTWQVMFLAVGLPGFLFALWVLSLRPTPRPAPKDGEAQPLRDFAQFVRGNPFLFVFHFIGLFCLAIPGYATFGWVVTAFNQMHGLSAAEFAPTYGWIALSFGLAGGVLAGVLAEALIKRGRADGVLLVIIGAALVTWPMAAFWPQLDSPTMALLLLCPVTLAMGFPAGMAIAALQQAAPPHVRSQAAGFYLIIVNFLSYQLGPLIVGWLLDDVYGTREAIGEVFTTINAIAYPAAILALLLCLPHFRRALRERAAEAAA